MKQITLICILLFCGCREVGTVPPLVTKLEGTSLPEFSILTTEAKYLTSSNLPDQLPVVIFYFSPGCIQCRVQTRNIKDYISELEDTRILMVTSATLKEALLFSNHFKLDRYPNITVGIDTGYVLSTYYKAKSVPYTAIYDKNRAFRRAYVGRLEGKQLVEVTHRELYRTLGKR